MVLQPKTLAESDAATVPPSGQFWRNTCFSEAVIALVEDRHLSLHELALMADLPPAQLERLVEGPPAYPPLGVMELVASALRFSPDDFLEYRLASLLGEISRDWNTVDHLFLESLSEIERNHIDPGEFDHRGLREIVTSVLNDEEMTLAELAQQIGVKTADLSAVIAGRWFHDWEIPGALADLLGLPTERLLACRLALVGEWLRTRPDDIERLLIEVQGFRVRDRGNPK